MSRIRLFAAHLRGVACLLLAGTANAALPITHWTQPSGAQVYLVQSPAIPMVDVQIDFDAGSRREPQRQAGLASAAASGTAFGVRASGHLPALDENALSDAWADLGATFGGDATADRLSFSLRTLTLPELLQHATELASRQLGEPSYPQAVWARERQKHIDGIKEANTRPTVQAARAFAGGVYGSHPYGYEVNAATLKAIQTADLRAWHDRYFRACYAKVSLVGALEKAQADILVTRLLARIPAGPCPELPPVAEVEPLPQAREIDIAFASAQAQVLIGAPGMKRSDPDYFALLVGNHILGGGGFTARLTEEVRQKRGLTYSIYSYFAPGLHAGAFTIGLQTRPDQAAQALALVREVVSRYVQEGPTEAELQAAKDNLVGGFALRLDSNRKLLDNISNIAVNKLSLDYLDTWTAQIAKLTVDDVHQAMARAVHPERMVTVVLGAQPAAPAQPQQ